MNDKIIRETKPNCDAHKQNISLIQHPLGVQQAIILIIDDNPII